MGGTGQESFLNCKLEAVYGTKATSGFWGHPFIAEDFDLQIEDDPEEYIQSGLFPPAAVAGRKKVAFTLTLPLTFNLCPQWYRAFFTAAAETTPGGGTTSRQQIFDPDTSYKGMTVELCVGDVPGAYKVHTYVACTPTSLEWQFPETGRPRLVITGFGLDEDSAAGGASPSAEISGSPFTPEIVRPWGPNTGVWTLKPAISGVCIRSMRVKIDKKGQPKYCMTSQSPTGVSFEDWYEMSGEYVMEYTSRLIYNDFKTFTQEVTPNQNSVALTGGIIEGAIRYALTLHLNSLRWTSPGRAKVDKRGTLVATCPFVGEQNGGTVGDGTGQPFALTAVHNHAISTF